MIKQLWITASFITASITAIAQRPMPLPRQDIAKPQANVRLLELSDVINSRWRGARIKQLPGAVNVDSVWLEMKSNGTFSFKHQQYEFNGPIAGTYVVTKNKVVFSVNKFPFYHTLDGQWDINTGIISGRFKEVREKDPAQPSYYVPGTNTGSFSLTRY
jgi:hypothetical protein